MQGCITAPRHIKPADMPITEYLSLTCDELEVEHRITALELKVAEERQKNARKMLRQVQGLKCGNIKVKMSLG